jgi:hypothetical protein
MRTGDRVNVSPPTVCGFDTISHLGVGGIEPVGLPDEADPPVRSARSLDGGARRRLDVQAFMKVRLPQRTKGCRRFASEQQFGHIGRHLSASVIRQLD